MVWVVAAATTSLERKQAVKGFPSTPRRGGRAGGAVSVAPAISRRGRTPAAPFELLSSAREARADVLPCALGRQLRGARPAAHEEVTLRRRLHPLPLQPDRLRAPLTAHDADGLALDD